MFFPRIHITPLTCQSSKIWHHSSGEVIYFSDEIHEEFRNHLFLVTWKGRREVIEILRNSCEKNRWPQDSYLYMLIDKRIQPYATLKKTCKKSFGGLLRNKAAEVRKKIRYFIHMRSAARFLWIKFDHLETFSTPVVIIISFFGPFKNCMINFIAPF